MGSFAFGVDEAGEDVRLQSIEQLLDYAMMVERTDTNC
jgi:hypothetical protein